MNRVWRSFFVPSAINVCVFVARELQIPYAKAQRLVDTGRVKYAGKICAKGQKVCGIVDVALLCHEATLEPLFVSPYFAAFNKPAFLMCHPKSHFSIPCLLDSVYALFHDGVLVHRLDKETSGIILACPQRYAKTLGMLFEKRQIHKTYTAYCVGNIRQALRLDMPILRQKKGGDLCVRSIVSEKGKPSLTEVFPLHYDSILNRTLVKIIPHTGRTHQIRVHLYSAGYPILGDPLYGAEDCYARKYLNGEIDGDDYQQYFGASRLMLHAHKLEFILLGMRFCLCAQIPFD